MGWDDREREVPKYQTEFSDRVGGFCFVFTSLSRIHTYIYISFTIKIIYEMFNNSTKFSLIIKKNIVSAELILKIDLKKYTLPKLHL